MYYSNGLSSFIYQVYNVSPFLEEHPGGDEVMLNVTGKSKINTVWINPFRVTISLNYLFINLSIISSWNYAGKDATADFEDIGHSSYAEGLMKDFLIGKIDESTLPKVIENTAHHQPTSNKDSSDARSSILLYVLPLLMLGVAFLLRFYSKSE